MKKFAHALSALSLIISIVAVGFSPVAAKPAKPVAPKTVLVRAGTPISITTDSEISTKTYKTGDSFTGSLNNNIVVNKYVVARRGAAVTGIVTEADSGGRVKGKASIIIKLKSIQLANGGRANISSNTYTVVAKGSVGKDVAKVGIASGIGAAIGAIAGGGKGAAIGAGVGGGAGTGAVLATRGNPAVIPAESNLRFTLSSSISVKR